MTRRRGDEFESRNRQLPADLNQKQAYTTKARAVRDFSVTPQGTPPDCYDVRSVYDSRPLNGYDFNIQGSSDFSGASSIGVFFTVPEGFVAVLRSADIWFEDNPAMPGPSRSDMKATLQVNGGDVPQNGPVSIGSASVLNFFVVADEYNVVGLKLTSIVAQNVTAFVNFYGNLLLKTDRPANFEIANRTLTGACAPEPRKPSKAPAPAPALAPPPAPAPAPARMAPPAPVAPPPIPKPKIGLVNLVSSAGGQRTGGIRVGVHDPTRATVPGGFRAITRAEYGAYKTAFDSELQRIRKNVHTRNAELWLE